MSLSTTQYGYIVDPMVPFTDDKGKTIKNGFIRVFMAGTSTPVLTYRNYDGATNQEKIELDNSGRVKHNVIGSKGSLYKVVVYDAHHSQETPILTVDKIAVLGASINATGATIVTGLDSVTVPEEKFLKATVEGTGVELALDPTEVTSEVSTIGAAETAAPDYVVPLLEKTGTEDSKKISLANLFNFALDWISRLATTITSFSSGDFIAVSNTTNGTRKMSKDTLLELTAQNALAGNVAPEFVPSDKPNPTTTVAGLPYVYKGSLYIAREAYQGAWDADKFEKTNVTNCIKTSAKRFSKKGLQSVKTFAESDLSWTANKVVASNTGNVNDGTYKISSVDVSGVNVIKLTIPVFYRSDHTGMAFYDIAGNYISGMSVNRAFSEGFWKICLLVPNNAVELKTSWYQSGYEGYFELETFVCSESLTDNIAKFDSSVVADGYIHQNDGTVTSGAWSANLGEAQYIPCHGASYIKTNLVIFTSARNGGVCFFDENKNFLYCFNRNQGVTPSLESDVIVPVPDNAYYACILSFNYEKSILYGFFACDVVYPFNILKKRGYEKGYIHYSVVVNQTPNDWWKLSTAPSTPSYKRSTGVLLLPTNYTPEGKPTKLIVFCHGSSRNVTSIEWGLNNANFLAQKQRFADAGYAVLDCNGPCDNGGNPMIGVGSPQAFGAYKKCIEWSCDNFNIDPHPYIIGASAGGVVAFNLARTIQASALCFLSPNIDLKSFWDSGNKSVFVKFYGFADETTWEADKCLGYDMYGTIVDGVSRFVKCPLQLWRGSLESGGVEYPKMEAFVNALRSAGSIAALRTLEGADHSITNGGNPDCDQEVLDWFNRF